LVSTAAAASEEVTAVVDFKPETAISEAADLNEEAASSMDMQCHSPRTTSIDMVPIVEAQD
jgi:hypothetical protein